MPRNSVSRSEVLEILQELIRTPSVNPSIALDEGCGEEAIAKVARQCLEARGVKSWLEESAPGGPDVVAEVGAGNAETVVFCAHLDTVGTAGMTIPRFEPTLERDRVYGRGGYDMKGSAAAGIMRLLPVMITVGATVLALFALALHGGPLWKPLC